MTVIVPCHKCEGRGYTVSLTGQREDCPTCSGRGYFASTDAGAEEAMDWWLKLRSTSAKPLHHFAGVFTASTSQDV